MTRPDGKETADPLPQPDRDAREQGGPVEGDEVDPVEIPGTLSHDRWLAREKGYDD